MGRTGAKGARGNKENEGADDSEEEEEEEGVELDGLVDAVCVLLQAASRQIRSAPSGCAWQLVSGG
jgi:hypothetical protein